MTAAGRQPRPGSPTGRSRAGCACPCRAQSEAVSRRQGRRLCPGGAPSFRKVRAGPLSGGGKTRPGAQNLVTPRPLGPHVVLTPPTPFRPGLTLEVGRVFGSGRSVPRGQRPWRQARAAWLTPTARGETGTRRPPALARCAATPAASSRARGRRAASGRGAARRRPSGAAGSL